MLEVIGAAPGSHTDIDWHQTWRGSPEYQEVHRELDRLKNELPQLTRLPSAATDKASLREFAAPFTVQLREVLVRVFEQYWRTPCKIKNSDVFWGQLLILQQRTFTVRLPCVSSPHCSSAFRSSMPDT